MEAAEVVQRLDASGEFRVLLPLTDPRTASIALNRVWKEYRETEGFVFAGIIESIRKTPDDRLEITGPTLLAELLYRNTLLNLAYEQQPINTIIADLISGSGWIAQAPAADVASNVATWNCLGGGFPAWSACIVSLASFSGVGQPEITNISSAVNVSWAHTVPAGSNRKLVVAVSVRADVDVTAVSYGGTAMTQGPVAINAAQNRVEFWYLDNPTVGTANIVITGAGNETAGAISFSNAATGALTDSASATGFTTTPTVTQAALASMKVSIAAVCAHDINTVLVSADREELWNASQQGGTIGAGAISPPVNILSVRYDGESKLKAVLSVLESQGLHLREHVTDTAGVLTRAFDRGAFGLHSGIVLMGGQGDIVLLNSPAVRMAADLSVEDVSQELWNWIVPLGAGEGTAQLTLEHQTRLPNLLTNASFEDGLTGWTSTLGGASTIAPSLATAAHRKQSLLFTRSGGDAELTQDIAAVPGQVFDIEAWTQLHPGAGGGSSTLYYEFRNGGGVITTASLDASSTGGLWERLAHHEIVAPATTTILRVRLRTHDQNCTAEWDAVRCWKSASGVAQPYDVFTELTDPHSVFPTMNWYLKDAASVTAHGTRQRAFVAKDVVPLAADKASMENAADALYALAAAQLAWWRNEQTVYSVNAIELPPSVLPGDLLRLRWKGTARHFEQDYVYLDIDDDLWVLERRRRFEPDGTERSFLTVSTIDRLRETSQDVVIGKLEDTSRIYRTHIQTSVVPLSAHFVEDLDATHPMLMDFVIPDNVVQLLRCKIRIKPRAIRSPINVASSGGGQTSGGGSSHSHTFSGGTVASGGGDTSGQSGSHSHQLSLWSDIGGAWVDPPNHSRLRFRQSDGGAAADVIVGHDGSSTPVDDLWSWAASSDHTHSTPNHSHGFSGGTNASESSHSHSVAAHTHNLTFGIFESTSATNMTLSIDGTDRTAALGGPWTSTVEVDVTNYLLDDDGVVVQGAHAISIGSSQLGRAEVFIDGVALMAPFRML